MKCSCTICGKHIEYDAASAGTDIACPHCGQTTKLAAYTAAPPPLTPTSAAPPRKNNTALILILVIVIGAVLVLPVVGLLAAIAIPNFIKARQTSQRAACVANLKSIEAAKSQWALENRKTDQDVPADADLFGGRYMNVKPVCPANGLYTIGSVSEKPSCTISDHQF